LSGTGSHDAGTGVDVVAPFARGAAVADTVERITPDLVFGERGVAIARELAAYCWEIATYPITTPAPTPTPTTRKRLTNLR
jgi:hypothetical protein